MPNMARKVPDLIDTGELEPVEEGNEHVRHDWHGDEEGQAEIDEGGAIEVHFQRRPQH